MKTFAKTSITFLLLLFYSIPAARADIEGATRFEVIDSSGRILSGQRLAGAKVEGSWTEAFVDFAQFGLAVRELLDGNPYGGYQAYQEFNQFLDAAGDHGSIRTGRIVYIKGSNRVRHRLQFRINSDDDPIGAMNVAFPNEGSLGSSFSVRKSGIGSRQGNALLEYDPETLAEGRYVFAFYGKETDCHSCLSITNIITLDVKPAPIMCRVPAGPCTDLANRIDQAYVDLAKLEDEEIDIINSVNANSADAGTHALINRQKKSFEICQHLGAPGTARYDECMAMVPDVTGFCPQIAFAMRDNAVCNSLDSINQRRRSLQDQIVKLTLERSRYSCCLVITGPNRPVFN